MKVYTVLFFLLALPLYGMKSNREYCLGFSDLSSFLTSEQKKLVDKFSQLVYFSQIKKYESSEKTPNTFLSKFIKVVGSFEVGEDKEEYTIDTGPLEAYYAALHVEQLRNLKFPFVLLPDFYQKSLALARRLDPEVTQNNLRSETPQDRIVIQNLREVIHSAGCNMVTNRVCVNFSPLYNAAVYVGPRRNKLKKNNLTTSSFSLKSCLLGAALGAAGMYAWQWFSGK